MQIGGFDVLLFNKKGTFSTLAKASRVLIRPKGVKKDAPWLVLTFTRQKTLVQKEKFINRKLIKLSAERDREAEKTRRERPLPPPPKLKKERKKKKKFKVEEDVEPVPKKPKKKKDTVLPKIEFKSDDKDTTEKAIRTRAGKDITIKKFYYYVDDPVDFIHGRKFINNIVNGEEQPAMIHFFQAAKEEFMKKIFKRYKTRQYLIRFFHDYSGLPDDASKYKPDAGFGGKSINRATFTKEQIEEQFDEILPYLYLEDYSTYLRKGTDQTYFRFTGFSVEVTLRGKGI